MRLASMVAGLLLAGCVSSGEPATAGKAPPAGDPAPAPAPVDPAVAIKNLTATPATSYYLPGDGAVLYAVVVHVEGTGSQVSAVMLRAGEDKDEVAEWPGDLNGDDDEVAEARKEAEQAQSALAARLAGKDLVPLTYTEWPKGKAFFELASPAVRLDWKDGRRVEATVGGKKVADAEVSVMEPHVPRPAGVYASAASPALLVAIDQDPGEAYTEGFNFFTEMVRVDLRR